MKRYLGIDPGKTSGYAIVDEDANLLDMGQLKFDEVTDFLKGAGSDFEEVIIESYQVYGRLARQHTGSKLETSQVIGKVKFWAEMNDIIVVMQPANILTMAQKWTQVKMPTNHSVSHQVSAYLHVAYHLMKDHGAPTAIEKRAAAQSDAKRS